MPLLGTVLRCYHPLMAEALKVIGLGQGLWGWVRVIGMVLALAGMWFKMEAKVDAAILQAEKAKDDIAQIRDAIMALQLDTAKLCVAQLGIENCETAGRGR